jgi:hypothetical protein
MLLVCCMSSDHYSVAISQRLVAQIGKSSTSDEYSVDTRTALSDIEWSLNVDLRRAETAESTFKTADYPYNDLSLLPSIKESSHMPYKRAYVHRGLN